MNQTTMGKVFWTAFGVGEVALLGLLLMVVNSAYSWAAAGAVGVLVLLAGMGGVAGVFVTASSAGERRWCVIGATGLLVVAGVLLVLAA